MYINGSLPFVYFIDLYLLTRRNVSSSKEIVCFEMDVEMFSHICNARYYIIQLEKSLEYNWYVLSFRYSRLSIRARFTEGIFENIGYYLKIMKQVLPFLQ